ncbi:DUF4097 domain-containing protein [Christiangramia sabulilitoris]|uniref:DUF4097 domain-containing protein n=1 Tax=Christiangramia sabulilitoris TaxID=2583991 RepID=A0A550HWZ1_9FLAO|nr:DUF4097 domain-containing protein [Christiangramia sabulilitoris]TRO63284.1 DUF4097 domain-containing protein [Christiangramia sabulilitoris]
MKTILSSILILFVLIPGTMYFDSFEGKTGLDNSVNSGKHTKEKKVKKEFKVNPSDELKINNSYGNVDITTWDQNRVVIEVIIKTNGNDEEKVAKKLDEINIAFEQAASGVSAKTRFSKEDKSWWKEVFGGSDNVNVEVNYIVRAPVSNHLDINNDYGGIYIDKSTGNTKINCDYGKMDIGELKGSSNYLNFDYTRGSSIGYVTNAEINADYSDFEIGEAGNLMIKADYTQSKVGKVSNMEFNCDYGSMDIDKVKVLIGNGDYLSTRINRIFESADINLDYGSLSIEKVIKGAKNIEIDTDYAGVKLGYDNEMSFNFLIKTSYGNVSGLDGLNIKTRNERSTGNEVTGSYGSGEESRFRISTSYGNVKFQKK